MASQKQRNPVYVTQAPKHLISALRNTLQELEMTVSPDTNQVIFAELKRILNQRIAELEMCAVALPRRPTNPKSQTGYGQLAAIRASVVCIATDVIAHR
jgi:hypothetical protein